MAVAFPLVVHLGDGDKLNRLPLKKQKRKKKRIKVSLFSESTFCFSVSFTFRNVSKNTPALLRRCSLNRVDANIGILSLTDASLRYRPSGRQKPSRSDSNAAPEASSGTNLPNLPAAGSWSSGHICLDALGPDAQRPERWPGAGIQAAGRPEMDTRTDTSGDKFQDVDGLMDPWNVSQLCARLYQVLAVLKQLLPVH